jgi:hypothetical protein
MEKLSVVLTLLALVPFFSPPTANALTLAERVQKLEGRLNCLKRVPMNECADYAGTAIRWMGPKRRTPVRRAPTRRSIRRQSTTRMG